MKKIAIIITAVIYLFLSVGIRVNTHYCGDQISSVDIFFSQGKNCCGKEDLARKCCKDKVSYLKLTDSQKHSSAFIFSAPDFLEALIPSPDYSSAYHLVNQELFIYASISFFDSDVLVGKNPIYLVNRSFRV